MSHGTMHHIWRCLNFTFHGLSQHEECRTLDRQPHRDGSARDDGERTECRPLQREGSENEAKDANRDQIAVQLVLVRDESMYLHPM